MLSVRPYDNEQFSLSKDEMILAVAAERKRRFEKGHSFHCFVTSSIEKYPKTKWTELNVLLSDFKKGFIKGKIPDQSRIHLLVHCGAHWTAVDLLFDKKEGVSVFIIDAAGEDRYLLTLAAIIKNFPNTETLPSKIYLAIKGLQWDMEHCAVFSLHHVFKASKISDLHTDLAQRQPYFVASMKDDQPYSLMNVNQLPPTLVSVMQKSSNLTDYLAKNTQLIHYKVTKKGLSLHEIVWGNTDQTGPYSTNKYIEKIKIKTKKIAEAFYHQNTPLAKHILKNHLSFTMTQLRKPDSKPAYHTHQICGLLTELSVFTDKKENDVATDLPITLKQTK